MKRILFFTVPLMALCIISSSLQAQKCSGPVPVVSVYYPIEKGMKYGIGLEAGNLGGDSPFGLFAGFNVQKKSELYQKQDSSYAYDLKSSFYIKGTFRITRIENAVSLYAIAAPQVSLEKGLEFQPGFRVVFPVGQKLALGVEPMFSLKERRGVMNLHISF